LKIFPISFILKNIHSTKEEKKILGLQKLRGFFVHLLENYHQIHIFDFQQILQSLFFIFLNWDLGDRQAGQVKFSGRFENSVPG